MLHRRVFLQILGATTVAVTGARAQTAPKATPSDAVPSATPAHNHQASQSGTKTLGSVQKAYTFFSEPEIAFIEAATARLIPSDDLGGGAAEAEVAYFIDQQLDGDFGFGARTYRQGPWTSETGLQGYQLALNYRELYRIGIGATDQYCEKTYGDTFSRLTTEQQDDVLKGLEDVSKDITLQNIPASVFFKILLQNTKEGFFSDPIHGGNQGMIGWKMVGFPGVGGDYSDLVEAHSHNQPADLEPVGIREMQQGAIELDQLGHPVHKFADRSDIRKAIKLAMGSERERSGRLPWDGELPPSEVV